MPIVGMLPLARCHVPTARLAAPQLDTSKFQPSHYDDNQIISNQVDICDVLIANKCDVVSPAKAQALVDWAHGLFPPKHQVSSTLSIS